MAESFNIGDRVRAKVAIYEPADDHSPGGYLCSKGALLIVRAVRATGKWPLSVSHEDITDDADLHPDTDSWHFEPTETAFISAASPDQVLRLIAVARAAKYVGYSNGFDAAYPDKLAALRESLAALEGVGNQEGRDKE